jgi:hypothetical protein
MRPATHYLFQYSTESTESTTGSQQSSSNFSTAEFSQSQEYDKLAKSDRVDEDGSGGSKGLGRPRYAVQISRDTAMNRIQVGTTLAKSSNIR